MKTTENLDKTQFLAVLAGTLLALGSMLSANAQTVYSVNIVGFRDVADRTTQLLTAPMTVSERQARHARNFYELPPTQRPLYLFALAYDVSVAVTPGGKPLSSPVLAEDLQAMPSIYDAPTIAPQYSDFLAAHVAIVNSQTALRRNDMKPANHNTAWFYARAST